MKKKKSLVSELVFFNKPKWLLFIKLYLEKVEADETLFFLSSLETSEDTISLL